MKKLFKVIACVFAFAMLASFACAEKVITYGDSSSADDPKGNLAIDISDFIAKYDAEVDDVYGVKVVFDEDSKAVIANGAGGGFIFNTESGGWDQKQWCNGCGDDEGHEIQVEADGVSIVRLEATPFSKDDSWVQVVLCMWWGGDITIANIQLLDADGVELPRKPVDTIIKPENGGVSHNSSFKVSKSDVKKVDSDGNELEGNYMGIALKLSPIYNEDTTKASWNDWCTAYIKYTDDTGYSSYVVIIGDQVSWDVTVDDNGTPDNKDDDVVIPLEDCIKLSEQDTFMCENGGSDMTAEVIAMGWDDDPDTAFLNVDAVAFTDSDPFEFPSDEEPQEPTDTPTTTPTDAPTTAPTDAATAPNADSDAGNDQPQTGDNGIAVLAVVAMISLAGAVVVKKHNA